MVQWLFGNGILRGTEKMPFSVGIGRTDVLDMIHLLPD